MYIHTVHYYNLPNASKPSPTPSFKGTELSPGLVAAAPTDLEYPADA